MSPPSHHHGHSLGLVADLYQLTMAFAYWKQGLAEREAVFHLSFRASPFRGSFAICCGLQSALDYLTHWHFDETDLGYLATLETNTGNRLFPSEFLDYLSTLHFAGNIDAIREGTVVFPQQPLLRIRGPLLPVQLVESGLLNLVNFQTLICTKAARICLAAAPTPVVEFGLRRAQGFDAALFATRAAFIGGCTATSNLWAGKQLRIPVRGTHAHSWVLAFEDERTAFEAFADVFPDNCVFLVDTFQTTDGVQNAIEVGRRLRKEGHELVGVRLDSGDLGVLSQQARTMLDDAGFQQAVIVASNDLDEDSISAWRESGAPIGMWGVGTRLVTGYDQPSLGGVYKLSALRNQQGDWQHKLKRSENGEKSTFPGILQVRRFHRHGAPCTDMLYDELTATSRPTVAIGPNHEVFPIDKTLDSEELLIPVMREGVVVTEASCLEHLQQHARDQLTCFGLAEPQHPDRGSGYCVATERNFLDRTQTLLGAGKETGP
ncbi:MAG: nicotinate phosphoribosyltransferase [Planctomycetaceae bacterium]|nr:nicotinate phosphoribosyltransferase [Planctomycetaceae bacterium]